MREIVLRLKHLAGEGLAEVIGDIWGDHAGPSLRDLGAAAVVPIPLHWRRYWERGYNQSEALAVTLAARLGIPCRPRWLRRIFPTPHQTPLTTTGRLSNVKNAFLARPLPAFQGRSILLVDDVMTTGSTASEAARALRNAGVGRVFVAVLTRAE